MEQIAVIAFWKWEFKNVIDEEMDNNPDGVYEFHHIKDIDSIPTKIRFDRVLVGGACEDVFSYSELEAIKGAIPVGR